MLYQILYLLSAVARFFLSTIVELVRLPVNYTANKAKSAIFGGEYQADIQEAIEVLQSMKSQTSNSRELAQLEHAAQLLKKSSSSSKDLHSLAEPKTLQVKDTNRFTSSHWFSRSFPDLFWALTSYVRAEWPVPARSERKRIKEEILRSKKVVEAIKSSARTNGWTEDKARAVAGKIFEEMVRLPQYPPLDFTFTLGESLSGTFGGFCPPPSPFPILSSSRE